MASANQIIQNASTRVLFLAVDDRDVQPPANTLLELVGANTASDTSGIQTVDISSFGDGFAVPKVKTALDGSYTVSGVVTDTPAHLAYRSLADGDNKEKEGFFLVINGDGSTESFYGFVTDYQTTRDQRDVLRFTSTVNTQSSRARAGADAGVQFFVSSLNGSDANSGTSSSDPFATFAPITTLEDGATVSLERGSLIKDALNFPAASGITVKPYGAGAKPIIDSSDAALPSDWTLASGQTNTYEISWDVTDIVGTINKLTVYEDGELLRFRETVADCEANPGSYSHVGAVTATGNTIYIHPKGSTNPTSDGKTYEIAKRQQGIFLGDNGTVDNVVTLRNVNNNGSLRLGGNATLTGVEALQGTKHNAYINSGTVTNSKFLYNDDYNLGTEGATLFVVFESDSSGNTATFDNCEFIGGNEADPATIASNTIGLFFHAEPSSPVADNITARNSTFTRLASGFSGDAEAGLVEDCQFIDNASIGGLGNGDMVYRRSDFSLDASGDRKRFMLAGSLEMDRCGVYTPGEDANIIQADADAVDITITNCSFQSGTHTAAPGAAIVAVTAVSTPNGSVTFTNNICRTSRYMLNLRPGPDSGTVVSDNNIVTQNNGVAPLFLYQGAVTNLANWRATVYSPDANSITGTLPDFTDAPNRDFTTNGQTATDAATLQAGVEYGA